MYFQTFPYNFDQQPKLRLWEMPFLLNLLRHKKMLEQMCKQCLYLSSTHHSDQPYHFAQPQMVLPSWLQETPLKLELKTLSLYTQPHIL